MKKLLSTLALSMLFCSVAVASPLTDYSQGHWSIDLTERNTTNSFLMTPSLTESLDFKNKYNFDGTVTVGLGHKFAVQYRNFQPKSSTFTYVIGSDTNTYNLNVKTSEFNVLYKLNNSTSALVGLIRASGNYVYTYQYSSDVDSWITDIQAKSFWQVGFVSSSELASNTTAWCMAAIGKHLTNYEVGVSYKLCKNMEFNVNYRELKLRDFALTKNEYDNGTFVASESDIGGLATNGLGFGLTYKY